MAENRVAELAGLQRALFDGEREAGWDPEMRNTFAEEIAHLHEEVSEAFRAYRKFHDFEPHYQVGLHGQFPSSLKPEGIPSELADVAIGLFYIAERWGFDLFAAIELKHAYNLTRNYGREERRLHE